MCYNVFGWTSQNPAASPNPLAAIYLPGTYGGTKWSKSNVVSCNSLVSWFSKIALWS